mgnify:CR=1 FL=1
MKGIEHMTRKRYTPEQIIRKLREAEVMISQGKSISQATRQFSYNLKVVSIKNSVAIAKLIEKAHPWVEVNIGDGVMLAY